VSDDDEPEGVLLESTPEWDRIMAMTDDELDDELRRIGLDPVKVAMDAEKFVERCKRRLDEAARRS